MASQTRITMNDAARAAIKSFRDSKPWKGTEEEKTAKFVKLHAELCTANEIDVQLDRDETNPTGCSARSFYFPDDNTIHLVGKWSVVTYLFCFNMASGATRSNALRSAVEVFKHFFPRSARNCVEVDGLMIKNV